MKMDPKGGTPESSCSFRTMIGGQALIEGILMRGPKKQAIVVRNSEGGLETKVEDLKLVKERHPMLGWPLLRGCVNFMDSIVKGMKALLWSAEFYPEDEGEPGRFEQWLERKFGGETVMKLVAAVVSTTSFAVVQDVRETPAPACSPCRWKTI